MPHSPLQLLDLHAHFPMHTRFPPRCVHECPAAKQLEFWAANLLVNYQRGRPRVSLSELEAGVRGGIASVLYNPDDEFFRSAEPRPEAFANILAQMDHVGEEIEGRLVLARNPQQVASCLRSGERFLFHCVEGALALGGSADNVDVLATRGVAYVVIAHLFFRGVACCANALPFVPDSLFNTVLNPDQPLNTGLTTLGRDIVERLMQQRILADITHCNEQAQDQILDIASGFGAPVIASHTGVRRTSDYPLNLRDETVKRIADSKGVVGIILYPHWLRHPREQFFGPEDVSTVFRAIDAVVEITGSHQHVAIGTDLDGFISPIADCPTFSRTTDLAKAIAGRYGVHAERILWANALETLGAGWRGV